MNTVCCFGEALIDFHGKPSGAAPVFTAHPGGAPANVSVAVAQLGGRAAFVGMFGRDMFGESLVLPRGATPLLGVVQLEMLDLVVVPKTQEVIPNPAHPDGPVG